MTCSFTALGAASLALVVWGATPLPAQPYHFVTNRGNAPGQLRVWELTVDGDLSVVQLLETPHGGYRLQIDPFGRFLVHSNGEDEDRIDLYQIEANKTLTLTDTYIREGWNFFNWEHGISPDGSLYITTSRNNQTVPVEIYHEAFHITEQTTFESLPGRLKIRPEEIPGLSIPGGELGCVAVDNGYALLHNNSVSGGLDVVVLPLSVSGEISPPIQILDYKWARHDWTVRLDQRIAVTGQTSNDHLATSFAVSPDGQLTEVGFYSAAEYGSLASNGVTFLPSGRSYATGGGYITSVPMERDGSFAGLAMVGPLGVISAHRPGVTPDGRFAVATWNSDSSGIHWGVYALNPYGGIELIRDHTFPFGYSDIAFIPPRTGEMLGDANADGQRDAADIVTYLNHLNDRGDFEEWHPLSPLIRGPVPKARADANQDGEITWGDLEWLLQFLLESDGN